MLDCCATVVAALTHPGLLAICLLLQSCTCICPPSGTRVSWRGLLLWVDKGRGRICRNLLHLLS